MYIILFGNAKHDCCYTHDSAITVDFVKGVFQSREKALKYLQKKGFVYSWLGYEMNKNGTGEIVLFYSVEENRALNQARYSEGVVAQIMEIGAED